MINRLVGPSNFSGSPQITQSKIAAAGAVLDRSGGPALLGVHVLTMIQNPAVLWGAGARFMCSQVSL
jgi:hypothetical protein